MTPEQEADIEKFLARLEKFQAEANTTATGYEQVVIGLGYAAFLTLWSQMAPHLPRTIVLMSGGLISVSLTAYILWTIGIMVWRQQAIRRLQPLFALPISNTERLQKIQEEEAASVRRSAWIMQVWPWVFGFSFITGLAAALSISGSAFWGVVYAARP